MNVVKSIGFVVFLFALDAAADPCAPIRDHDQRQLCRAHVTGDQSHCSQIHDDDLRARCRAEVTR